MMLLRTALSKPVSSRITAIALSSRRSAWRSVSAVLLAFTRSSEWPSSTSLLTSSIFFLCVPVPHAVRDTTRAVWGGPSTATTLLFVGLRARCGRPSVGVSGFGAGSQSASLTTARRWASSGSGAATSTLGGGEGSPRRRSSRTSKKGKRGKRASFAMTLPSAAFQSSPSLSTAVPKSGVAPTPSLERTPNSHSSVSNAFEAALAASAAASAPTVSGAGTPGKKTKLKAPKQMKLRRPGRRMVIGTTGSSAVLTSGAAATGGAPGESEAARLLSASAASPPRRGTGVAGGLPAPGEDRKNEKKKTLRKKKIMKKSSKKSSSSSPSSLSGGGAAVASPAAAPAAVKDFNAPSGSTGGSSSGSSTRRTARNPLLFPDHREQILRIFQQLGEVNNALGEVYKSKSYTFAVQELRRGDHLFRILPPNLVPLDEETIQKLLQNPEQADLLADMQANLEKRQRLLDPQYSLYGVGDKLRKKVIEILETGDLEELHWMNKRPEVSAMRELCEVHGFGPRTALATYKRHKIKTVAELKKMAASPNNSLNLNDSQKLGLQYFDDIQQRIPHSEGKVHEAYLKRRLQKHFGNAFLLTVCGSFRRRTEFSGDIDVLLTPNPEAPHVVAALTKGGKKPLTVSSGSGETLVVPPPQDAVRAFVDALRQDGYIEATFAQGSTKFMGMSRLQVGAHTVGSKKQSNILKKKSKGKPSFPARRIDVRYVDVASFPAALLYFTGSKNFNVVMRAKAVKLQYVLNEYGLFHHRPFSGASSSGSSGGGSSVNELITRLTKYQYWSRGENAFADDAALLHSGVSSSGTEGKEKDAKMAVNLAAKQKELDGLVKQLKSLRVMARSEMDIFKALDIEYVEPWDRCL